MKTLKEVQIELEEDGETNVVYDDFICTSESLIDGYSGNCHLRGIDMDTKIVAEYEENPFWIFTGIACNGYKEGFASLEDAYKKIEVKYAW